MRPTYDDAHVEMLPRQPVWSCALRRLHYKAIFLTFYLRRDDSIPQSFDHSTVFDLSLPLLAHVRAALKSDAKTQANSTRSDC